MERQSTGIGNGRSRSTKNRISFYYNSCGYTCLLPKVTLWVIALGWDRFGFPFRFSPPVTLVVYHLPEKSGNFGWNVNGKTIFFFPNGNFHGKMGILER